MTLETAYFIASIGAAVAVVVSLIFVGLQLAQTTRAIRADAEHRGESEWATENFNFSRDPASALLAGKIFDNALSVDDLSPTELAQATYFIRAVLQRQQSLFFLWKRGSLPEEYWETRRDWTIAFTRAPIVSAILEGELRQGILRGDFQEEILDSRGGATFAEGVAFIRPFESSGKSD